MKEGGKSWVVSCVCFQSAMPCIPRTVSRSAVCTVYYTFQLHKHRFFTTNNTLENATSSCLVWAVSVIKNIVQQCYFFISFVWNYIL